MYTILGAGGPVSNALTKTLELSNSSVRLVSRSPIKTTGNVTWRKADLLNYHETLDASKGSKVIYLCAGLKYDKKTWQDQWPKIMENAINVAKETGAYLIFFDNVYMYGKVEGLMTEDTPYNPISKKGEVRSRIATRLMDEAKAGNIDATIARSADFYGVVPDKNSVFDSMVIKKFKEKQKAQWIGNPKTLHSFTYVNDAAKALLLLAEERVPKAQVWHLPTAPAMQGIEFIRLAAEVFDTKPSFTTLNKFLLRTVGLFVPMVAEVVEMYYQYQFDYNFSSQKFESFFGFQPTPYPEGIQEIKSLYQRSNSLQPAETT